MKIIYIANVRIPTEKAHGVQIMKMCETFSSLGNEVVLVSPWRINRMRSDPFSFYDVKRNFHIKKVFSFDLLPLQKIFGKLAFYVQNWSFAVFASVYSMTNTADIIFSRDIVSSLLLGLLGKKTYYEIHDSVPVNFLTKIFLKKIFKFVSTNQYKKNETAVNFGIAGDRILVAPNGVDFKKFCVDKSKEECRTALGMPLDKKIAVYTGSALSWKGTNILKLAMEKLRDSDTQIKIVEGKPHGEIPLYLSAADVLVLPNTAKEKISQYETSPIKLFEYMAAGRPIVASDIPSVREIVNEEYVYLVKPDSPEMLAEGIETVLRDKDLGDRLAKNSRQKAEEYDWGKRAEKIIKFIYGRV